MARRKRSEMTEDQARDAACKFLAGVIRMGETSDPSIFSGPNSEGKPAMGPNQINVQLMVAGSFGVASDFFEAIRVLAGYKLPATHPKD